ncbi:MAG: aspartate-semialdehyde dehydrogenase [SAR324 cluster bacterium]|nr:aspartate-semialdehyde dehydrogenase [SAR324 cluster bacterium]
MKQKLNIALVGATGAVGSEFLTLLAKRNFPVNSLRALASPASAGKKVIFNNQELTVQTLTHNSFEGIDLAFFSAGAERSKEFAPSAVKAGALVIDNSSAFRMDDDVPLVVPECNAKDSFSHKGIIANPNCSTIQLLVAIKPLHDYGTLTKLKVATYQAVSGSGAKAIEELSTQARDFVNNRSLKHSVYPEPIFGNALPHVDIFLDNGYTKEEMKMVFETKKILHHPKLAISATCVRIPVWRAHSESIWVKFERKIDRAMAKKLWLKAPGIKVMDGINNYPSPLKVVGEYDTFVGRIREDISEKNGLCFWCVADQLLKGAALNALQIAEAYYDIKPK